MSGATRVTVAGAVAMAAIEVVTAFYIEVPAAAVVFAVLFAAGAAWLLWTSGVWAVGVLALLFAIEIVFLPTYERDTTIDWGVQLAALAASVVGIAAAFAWLLQRRRARSATG